MPQNLQQHFRYIDPTRREQTLTLRDEALTRVEAQYVHHFMRSHPRALDTVHFSHCTFDSDDGCVHILKDCFAAAMNSQLHIYVSLTKDNIDASWFSSVTNFASIVSFFGCTLVGAEFTRIVDIILAGNAKEKWPGLNVGCTSILSKCLVDVARLVEHTKLKTLMMNGNAGLLDHPGRVQLLCNKLKKNKFLRVVELIGCSARKPTADMLVDMLTVNTTLTELHIMPIPGVDNDINQLRLEPWLRRNKRLGTVLAGVQALHNHPNNNQQQQQQNANNEENNIIIADEISCRLILSAAMEDVDRDRSALYILMCKGIVGDGQEGEASPLHGKMVDLLKLASSINKDNTTNSNSNNSGGGGKRARLS